MEHSPHWRPRFYATDVSSELWRDFLGAVMHAFDRRIYNDLCESLDIHPGGTIG